MQAHRISRWLRRYFPLSLHDVLVTLGILSAASALCLLLQPISEADSHVTLIFVLAVVLISRWTEGYLMGFAGCLFAVFGVNYAFTYPYFKFNFSMTGYPLTFVITFVVSVIIGTLTSRVKQSEQIRMESEREKMRANLLRGISHDFRTPMTSIIGALNAVIEDNGQIPREEQIQLLTDARSDAEWLIHMMENLLSITRISDDPAHNLHKEPQAAEEVMWDAVSHFRKQYPAIQVHIQIPDDVLMVPMDALLIEQVIGNLLMNAATHGKTVTEIVLSVRREKQFAVFRVTDNGVGIDRRTLPLLFDGISAPRPRAESGDASRNMGIGLSVCKSIIRAHGGRIFADASPQGGAVFTFTLPLEEDGHVSETEDPDR